MKDFNRACSALQAAWWLGLVLAASGSARAASCPGEMVAGVAPCTLGDGSTFSNLRIQVTATNGATTFGTQPSASDIGLPGDGAVILASQPAHMSFTPPGAGILVFQFAYTLTAPPGRFYSSKHYSSIINNGQGIQPPVTIVFCLGGTFAALSTMDATVLASSCSGVLADDPSSGADVTNMDVYYYQSLTGTASGNSVAINAITTASSPPYDYTYYFPHLAFGGGWQTTLTYVSYDVPSAVCQTSFYSDLGAPLTVPFADVTGSQRTDYFTIAGQVHVQTDAAASADLQPGWAVAQCSQPMKASVLYRYYDGGVAQGEAGVNATTTPTTEFVSFAQTQTGLAYANPSSSTPALLVITALDANGAALASTEMTLQPLQHGAANIGPLLGLASFSGSVQLTSTAPIVAAFINSEAFPVFSSLPPADLPSGTPLAGSVTAGQSASTTYYFPHLAFGGGWQSTITYVNYSPLNITCQTTFYSDSGTALQVPFPNGMVSERSDNLSPGATIRVQTQTSASAGLTTGWAQAKCNGPLKASLLYRLYSDGGAPLGEAGVNAVTTPGTQFDSFAETNTGLAYANPSSSTATVGIYVLSTTGVLLGNTTVTLPPGAHGAANIGPLVGLANFKGSVQINSDVPIVTLFVNSEAYPVFSSLPPADIPPL